MKIKAHRILEVHSAITYFTLLCKERRPDIQAFLKGEVSFSNIINSRIKAYLKGENIYDDSGTLTPKGQIIREQGINEKKEQGKYKIWFVQDDCMFDTRILYFEREAAREGGSMTELNINFNKKWETTVPINGGIAMGFKVISEPSELKGQLLKNIDHIKFEWLFDEQTTGCSFTGSLNKGPNIDPRILPNKHTYSQFLSYALYRWDDTIKACPVNFDDISDDEKLSMLLSCNNLDDFSHTYDSNNNRVEIYNSKNRFIKGYKNLKIEISDMPIYPADERCAEKWRNWLLKYKLKHGYHTESDLQSISDELMAKRGFDKYQLPSPTINSLQLDSKDDSSIYWHAMAPTDLNPYALYTNNDRVSMSPGHVDTIASLICKLGLNNIPSDSIVIYYDNFVRTPVQQRFTCELLDAITARKKILITLAGPDFNDTIISHYKSITLKTISDKLQHDRYIIVGNRQGELIKLWDVTNSNEYIELPQGIPFEKNTHFRIKNTATYYKWTGREAISKAGYKLMRMYNNEF